MRAKLLDIRALTANHHTRPRGLNGDAGPLRRPFDHHLGNSRLTQIVEQIFADTQIFMQQPRVIFVRIPTRIPCPVDSEAQADRIDFLTHYSVSSRSRTMTVKLLKGFWMPPTRPRARALNRFNTMVFPTVASFT